MIDFENKNPINPAFIVAIITIKITEFLNNIIVSDVNVSGETLIIII